MWETKRTAVVTYNNGKKEIISVNIHTTGKARFFKEYEKEVAKQLDRHNVAKIHILRK